MRKRIVLNVLWIVLILTCIVGCGRKKSLEGTWKKIDYRIDRNSMSIKYFDEEITFKDGELKWAGKDIFYKIYDNETIRLNIDSLLKDVKYSVNDNVLLFDGDTFYKAESQEYDEYCIMVKKQAQDELNELVELIKKEKEEEQARIVAKEEALNNALESWYSAVDNFVATYIEKVEEAKKNIEVVFSNYLEGTWISKSNKFHSDMYLFQNGEVDITVDWGWKQKSIKSCIKVDFHPTIDLTTIDENIVSNENDLGDMEYIFRQLRRAPFDEGWSLEDLQNADSYIREKMECLYVQLAEIGSAYTITEIKERPEVVTLYIPFIERDYVSVDISSLKESYLTVNDGWYEMHKQ